MLPRPISRLAAASVALAIAAAVTACTYGAGTTSGPSSGASAAASIFESLPPATDATQPASTAEPSPTVAPTPNLGPFTCALPETGTSTAERALITDVRVGTHDGYDRIVLEFTDGIPAYTVSVATPPFTRDPSGLPLTVQGTAFWQLVLSGGTRMMPDGTSSYDGPTDFTPGYPKLVELVEAGDFEAVSSWYIGMSGSSCIRVLALEGPSRLVIDIEH